MRAIGETTEEKRRIGRFAQLAVGKWLELPFSRIFPALFFVVVLGSFAFSFYRNQWKGDGSIIDIDRYDTLARSILERREFGYEPGKPTAEREPLYPLVLALAYAALGRSWLSMFLLHALLQGLSLWLIWLTSKEFFGRRAGMLAMALYVLYPFPYYYAATPHRENLIVPLFLCSNFLALRASRSETWRPVGGAAILFSLLVLARAPFFVYAGLAGLLIALCRGRAKGWARALVCYFFIFSMGLCPWAVRNRMVMGRWVLASTQGGYFLYMSLFIPTDSGAVALEQPLYDRSDPVVVQALSLPQAEADKLYYRASLKYLSDRPWEFLRRFLFKCVKLWRLYPYLDRSYEFHVGWIQAIYLLSDGWLIPLGFLALVFWRRRWKELLFLWAPIACLTFVHGVFWAATRYRLPLMPLLIACVAAFLLEKLGVSNDAERNSA